MNCKHCQERIAESLAAGAYALSADVVFHQNSCAACSDFYATQRNLFDAVDAGLSSLVNQPVPPSLLPAVRDRLAAQPLPGTFRIPNWSFAVVAALAILAVGITYQSRRPFVPVNPSEIPSIASRPVDNPQPAVLPDLPSHSAVPKLKVRHSLTATSLPTEPDAEVIVLPEEREAFARFVAQIPQEQNVALALTRPAQAETEEPIEIARLQIDSLEVKPLEASSKD
jgi:hypothetical protein